MRKKIGYVQLGLGVVFVLVITALLLGMNSIFMPVVIAGVIFLAQWLFFTPGFRRIQPSAEDLLAQDDRPPVILLRSFLDDDIKTGHQKSRLPTQDLSNKILAASSRAEVGLAMLLNWIGPVIAIGKPGEKLPRQGAARAYVSDEEWQSTIAAWTKRCRLVVMVANHPTPGTQWEIQHAREGLHPEQFVLHFPKGLPDRGASYSAYTRTLSEKMGVPFPPFREEDEFLRFDDNWVPHCEKDVPALAAALIPNFKRPPIWQTAGPARVGLYLCLVAGLVLELAVFLYSSFSAG